MTQRNGDRPVEPGDRGLAAPTRRRIAASAEAESVSRRSEPRRRAGETSHRPRVLIVDDNADSVDMFATLLELDGHEVATACDGAAALEVAADFRPDVALIDIQMPGLDGYEVARRARREAWGRELVLVAITGWDREADESRSREAGFDHRLTKPVDPVALAKLLASVELPERA